MRKKGKMLHKCSAHALTKEKTIWLLYKKQNTAKGVWEKWKMLYYSIYRNWIRMPNRRVHNRHTTIARKCYVWRTEIFPFFLFEQLEDMWWENMCADVWMCVYVLVIWLYLFKYIIKTRIDDFAFNFLHLVENRPPYCKQVRGTDRFFSSLKKKFVPRVWLQ